MDGFDSEQLPLVETFSPQVLVEEARIPGLGVRLVDFDAATSRQRREALDVLRRVLERKFLLKRGVTLCGPDYQVWIDRLFRRAQADDHKLQLTPFLAALGDGVVRDDSDCDPRLVEKWFVVLSGLRVLGSFTLYNVVTEKEDSLVRVISAMPMPGCRAAPDRTLRATWSMIMRWLLENDLALTDGRALDLVEWRFPSRPGHQWKDTPEEHLNPGDDEGQGMSERIVTDLADHDLVHDGDVPKSIRRRVAATATRPRRARV